MTAIEATGLRKEFESVTAVEDLTMTVPKGAIFGLVGPDGAGKSTLIRMLTTVIAATSGDALVFGHSVTTAPRKVKPLIGYMSQDFSLYGDLTVSENLAFFAELRGVPMRDIRERSARLLGFSGLTEFSGRQARQLSGGMKQKLALAATLISEPDLLFLDEPTTGVDPVSRREFWQIISDLNSQGITVFVATPYMDEAERCTELAFMSEGRILFRDTPEGIKARVQGALLELKVKEPRAAMPVLQALAYVRSVDASGEWLRVLTGVTGAAEKAADADMSAALSETLSAAGIAVLDSRSAHADLETAFATLIPEGSTS